MNSTKTYNVFHVFLTISQQNGGNFKYGIFVLRVICKTKALDNNNNDISLKKQFLHEICLKWISVKWGYGTLDLKKVMQKVYCVYLHGYMVFR